MPDIFQIDPEEVKAVEWGGDHTDYDLQLYNLGRNQSKFIIINPWLEDASIHNYIDDIPSTNKCIVWKYNNDWVAKYFNGYWTPEIGYEIIEIVKPKFAWRKNHDLDRTMTFEDDPFAVFEPEPWDSQYELVWYMDPRFNPLPDKVWAISCKPMVGTAKGLKDMGYVTPKVDIEFNEHIPDLNLDLDSMYPAYYDLAHDCVYQLDPVHTPDETMWVVKFSPAYRKPKEWKWYGLVTPQLTVKYNTNLPKMDYDIDYIIPWHDLAYEHAWMLDRQFLKDGEEDIWAIKVKATKKTRGTKFIGSISPEITVEYNPDLPELSYNIDYVIPHYDFGYEHVWMLDKIHTESFNFDIWAVKAYYTTDPVGTKVVDSVTPALSIIYNSELPKLKYNLDYTMPYHDLNYEHVWMLDSKHTLDAPEDIWAVKVKAVKKPQGSKIVGTATPAYSVEMNHEIKEYSYPDNLGTNVQYYDFGFTNTWYLDPSYSAGNEIWAVKVDFLDNPTGFKKQGFISPGTKVVYNPALSYLTLDVDYNIPYYDRTYDHVWYLDPEYSNGEKIWVARVSAIEGSEGEKDMGYVTPQFPDHLDVIFISYNEPNAEDNYRRVLEKAPWAKRVSGVTGILEAHCEAAKLAKSDMFYVVDGDAYLEDSWKFDYQPGVFDRDCAYVWYSRNPVNDLTYGYGGVKLFAKNTVLHIKKWTSLDLTGSMPKLKVISKISNTTAYNTDEFSTWRSAFRECVKLCYNIKTQPDNPAHNQRFNSWKNKGSDRAFGKYANEAAVQAEQFVKDNTALTSINDRSWLEQRFDDLYPGVRNQ